MAEDGRPFCKKAGQTKWHDQSTHAIFQKCVKYEMAEYGRDVAEYGRAFFVFFDFLVYALESIIKKYTLNIFLKFTSELRTSGTL